MNARVLLVIAVLFVAGVVPTAGTALASAQECSFPISEVDATGTEVTIEEEPRRVVTLSPSAAQTTWEIGAKGKVVGVTKYAAYLEGASEKENVSGAGMQAVVVEKVVALEPDLVLAPNVIPNATVRKLRDAGLTVFRFAAARSIEDVYAKTQLTGRLVGKCEGGEETVAWMKERIGTVREAVSDEERPTVIYPLGGGFVAGSGTFIDEIVTTAGGRNLAAEANISGYRQISPEVVLDRDPEWVVLSEDLPTSALGDVYNRTTAMEEGHVIRVDPNHANQPAPRVVLVAAKIAKALHPEAYAAANATPTPTASPTASPTPTESPTASTTPSPSMGDGTEMQTTATPGQPGFGITVVLAALAAALIAARTRD